MSKSVCLLFPEFHEGFIMRKVPLGLAYLAASLRMYDIYVEAYNLNVDDIQDIEFLKFDFVGITCLTPFVSEVNNLSKLIKEKNRHIKIIIGGPHPTYMTEDVFRKIPDLSYAICGEGENSLPELVLHEERHETVNGVYFIDKQGNVRGTPNEKVDIHTLPYPDQRIFDHGNLEPRNPFRAITASRGCPFGCYNCQPILNRIQPFRLRSPEDVFNEIKYLQDVCGQSYFGFVDSEFPIKKEWLRKFFHLIKESNMDFSFHCNARSDLLDREILEIYKALNISRLAIGIESGVQRVINEVLHKNIDLEYAYDMFMLAEEIGINTHGHFMIGIPGETLEEMHRTLEYAIKLPAQSIEFNMLTPWPGTAFYDICLEKGYLTELNSADFNEKRECHISTEDFSNVEVMQFREEIHEHLIRFGWRNSPDGSVYFRPEK